MTRTALGHEEGRGGIMNSTLSGPLIGRGTQSPFSGGALK